MEDLRDALGGTVDGAHLPRERIAPQRFLAPRAPNAAARMEGRTVDRDLLRRGADWWAGRCDVLLVEGAGGLLSPLADGVTCADLAADLGFPLLVVARAGLGTINHTRLTLAAAGELPVTAVVLNEADGPVPDDLLADNAAQIAAGGDLRLAVLRHGATDLRTGAGASVAADGLLGRNR